ncbi:MAG: hypothetical protein V4603_02690 [Pseudomonadota bacterium]
MTRDETTLEWSIREKNLLVELLVNGLIALYYLPKLFWLLQRGDEALRGGAMVNLIIGVVMMAIFARIVLAMFLHAKQDPEPMDERDLQIERRGNVLFGNVLQICVLVVICTTAAQQMAWGNNLPVPILTPLAIANVLLVSLMMAGIAREAMMVVLYRRGV